MKSPPLVNCNQLIEHYGHDRLESLAAMEAFYSNEQSKKYDHSPALNEKTSNTGTMSCYCKDLKDDGYDLKNTPQKYSLSGEDGEIIQKSKTLCADVYDQIFSYSSPGELWALAYP